MPPKQITPRVPTIGSVSAVRDDAARQILQQLVDAHNARNGATEQRFVTAADVERALATVTVQPRASADQVVTGSDADQLASLANTVTTLQSQLALVQATLIELRKHSTLDGRDVGNADGNVPLNNGDLNETLNADMVDGRHVGHATGEIPVSDGVLCVGLNAEMVGGVALDHMFVAGAMDATGKTATGEFVEVTLGATTYYLPLYA